MTTSTCFLAAATVLALAEAVLAQDSAATRATIEQRVTALEAGFATLDTRLGLANAQEPALGGQSDLALAARIRELERAMERLTADLQRVERLADGATRTAADAQRDASRAEQTARDAASRAR